MKNANLQDWIPYEHIKVPESLAPEDERHLPGLAWEAAQCRRMLADVRRST